MLISCNNSKFKADWAGGLCYPNNYSAGNTEVEFFNDEGKNFNIPGAFCGTSWNLQGESRWFYDSELPDSIYVSYNGMNNKNQTFLYQGGHNLPKDKLIKLFKEGYKANNERNKFKYITVGMAPGGRVCVWADYVEIIRFKIKEIQKLSDSPLLFGNDNPAEYLRHHPIDYSFWDKPDSRYDLDFGFCSENGVAKYFNSFFYTKEGLTVPISRFDIDSTKWNVSYGEPPTITDYNNYQQLNEKMIRDKKLSLPVHTIFEWKIDNDIFYSTEVVMPKDLPKRFTTSYINPKTGRKSNYNRIIFGVEKDGEHCIIWLDGPGKQEKIMRFKGKKAVFKGETVTSGGYATDVSYY